MGEPITTEDVEAVIKKIDQDGSGEIEITEFTDFIMKGSASAGSAQGSAGGEVSRSGDGASPTGSASQVAQAQRVRS